MHVLVGIFDRAVCVDKTPSSSCDNYAASAKGVQFVLPNLAVAFDKTLTGSVPGHSVNLRVLKDGEQSATVCLGKLQVKHCSCQVRALL